MDRLRAAAALLGLSAGPVNPEALGWLSSLGSEARMAHYGGDPIGEAPEAVPWASLGQGERFSPTEHYGPAWPTIPDRTTTPGSTRDLTLEEILATKWSDDPRRVTQSMKQQAFDDYGLEGYDDPAYPPDRHGRRWQIDHLIPRQMGGADEQSNLWPAPYNATHPYNPNYPEDHVMNPWDVVRKDITANRLMKAVREGQMTLDEARTRMQGDWRQTYIEFYGIPDRMDSGRW